MQERSDAVRAYRFDEFTLSVAERELWRGEQRVQLSARLFTCLRVLIENRERAVDRDELIAAVWERCDLGDNLLAQLISRARGLIGDTGEQQRLIRTVAGFGYRWVGPVQPVEDVRTGTVTTHRRADRPIQPPSPASGDDAAQARLRADTLDAADEERPASAGRHTGPMPLPRTARIGARLALSGLIAAALIAAALIWGYLVRPADDAPPGGAALVLPVLIADGDDQQWMRIGLMSLIIERLHKAGQPVVPVDNVIAQTRGFSNPPTAAERDLIRGSAGIGLILETRATRSYDRWRVSIRSLHGASPPLVADGEAHEALEAAAWAADRLAAALGRDVPAEPGGSAEQRAFDALMRQSDALILAGQTGAARTLLDSAGAEQRAAAEFRYQRARVDASAGRFDEARKGYEALLDDLPAEAAPVLRGRTLAALGAVRHLLLRQQSTPGADDARAFSERTDQIFDEAVRLLESQRDLRELGRALIARARASPVTAALSDYGRARTLLEAADDRLGVAVATARLGILNVERDQFAQALIDLRSALDRLADFRIVDIKAEVLSYIALSELALLDPEAALRAQAQMADLVDQSDNGEVHGVANLLRARILLATGHLREAESLWRPAYASMRSSRNPGGRYLAHATAAAATYADGDHETAEREAQAALEDAIAGRMTARERASMWLVRVRALAALGADERLEGALTDLSHWADADGSAVAAGYRAPAFAERAAATGRTDAARDAYEEAWARLESGKVPADLVCAAASYAGWLIDQDRLEQAGDIAGRVANWAERDFDTALLQLRLYHAIGRMPAWADALARVRALAGDRTIAPALQLPPAKAGH